MFRLPVPAFARALALAAAVSVVGGCDSGPKPGEEGAYWGRKLVEEVDAAKRDAALKHLVEAMSGGLGMTPNQPRGSVFWVRLPLVRLQAAPPQPEDDIDDGR